MATQQRLTCQTQAMSRPRATPQQLKLCRDDITWGMELRWCWSRSPTNCTPNLMMSWGPGNESSSAIFKDGSGDSTEL